MPDPDEIRGIADPLARIRAVDAEVEAQAERRSALARVKREAVLELRKTMSLAAVARELGTTKSRVQQLEKPL